MLKSNAKRTFQQNLGCFFGLFEALNKYNKTIMNNNSPKFMNFNQSEYFFSIKQDPQIKFTDFNKGLSLACKKLHKSFNKGLNPTKLSEIFYEFKIEIGNYFFYFLQEFQKLAVENNQNSEPDNNFKSIQEIRKEKPYFMGAMTSFFIFSNEISFLKKLDLSDIFSKFRIIRFKTGFQPIFYIGFIEMLLKIHSFFIYYEDNLKEYKERIAKSERKLIEKAKVFQLNSKIPSINEIFH